MTEQKGHPEDYISVPGFKQTSRNVLKALFGTIFIIGMAIRRNMGIFLLVIACSLIIGYSYFLITPRVYKYDMVVEYNSLSRKAYVQIFNELNTISGKGGDSALSAELNLGKHVTSNIISFGVQGVDGQLPVNDTSSRPEGLLKVSVSLKTSTRPDELQNAVLNYVNTRPYLKKMKAAQNEVYKMKMDFVNSELAKLDTLKDTYNRFIGSGRIATTLYNNAFNPADIYTRSGELMVQKADLINWLSTKDHAVTAVDGFKQINYPTSASMSGHFIIAGVAGILIGMLICLLIEVKTRL
jgi:hypothetical protein